MDRPAPMDRIWSDAEANEIELVSFCNGSLVGCSFPSPLKKDQPNEDSACFLELNNRTGVFAVADGVGGAPAGHRASRIAVQHLVEKCRQTSIPDDDPDRGLRAQILDAIESANREILGWGLGAGTTIVVVEIAGDRFRTYHVGDSDAILISNRGRIKSATVGHAPVAQAVDIGILKETEALVHKDRNLITNCLGLPDMKIEIGPTLKIAPRDTLLIASDGLFDNLTTDEVAEVVRKGKLERQVARLVELVRSRMSPVPEADSTRIGKPDDLTVMAYRRLPQARSSGTAD